MLILLLPSRGALVLNEHSPLYAELKPAMDGMYSPSLGRADAMTLLYNSADLPQRLRAIAHNAQVRRAQQHAPCHPFPALEGRVVFCFLEQQRQDCSQAEKHAEPLQIRSAV